MLWLPFLFLNQLTSSCYGSDELIAVVQLIRHGQKVPYNYPKNNPNPVLGEIGSLTNIGKQQAFFLGQFTRSRYDNFLSTLNDNDFCAESTNFERTIQSAQYCLAGMLNPKIKIPVKILKKSVLPTITTCKSYRKELMNVLAHNEFEIINKRADKLYKYLFEWSGMNVTMSEIILLIEALEVQTQLGCELHEWTLKVFPEVMEEVHGWFYAGSVYTDFQKKFLVGSWLRNFLEYFEDLIEIPKSNNYKYRIFASHSYNLIGVLSILDDFDLTTSQFASSIYFELKNRTGIPTVDVWYKNGDDFKQLRVKNCGLNCTFNELRQVLEPWTVSDEIWKEMCERDPKISSDLNRFKLDDKYLTALERFYYLLNTWDGNK